MTDDLLVRESKWPPSFFPTGLSGGSNVSPGESPTHTGHHLGGHHVMGGGGNGGIGGDQHMDLLRSGSAASRLKSHFYDAPPPPPPHQPHQPPQSHLSAGMPHPPPPVSSPYSPHIHAFLSGGAPFGCVGIKHVLNHPSLRMRED